MKKENNGMSAIPEGGAAGGKPAARGIRQFIIVTGMSGAGKTMTLKVLEDLGFITIDSLPPELLPQLFNLLSDKPSAAERGVVATVDVRNVDSSPALARASDFIRVIDDIKSSGSSSGGRVRVIFLTASDEELLRRYERTRRVHPLSRGQSTRDGILREREILAPVLDRADVVIDTSMMDLPQHRERLLKEFFEETETGLEPRAGGGVSLLFSSFGFKYGVPQDSGFVFDVRCLPNPYYVDSLRELTGADAAVQEYLISFPETREFMSRCRNFLDYAIPQYLNNVKGQLHVSVGCTGGRHRSVAVAEWLCEAYSGRYNGVCVIHRDRPQP